MAGMEQTLLNAGVLGVLVAWFMFRSEKKTDGVTKALNNNNLLIIYLIETIANCPTNTTKSSKIRDTELSKIKESVLNNK